jgi:ribosomal protein S18 acetylase RimI-like enzyme
MKTGEAAIRDLEERGLNAWPALQTLFVQGWVVRFAQGYTKRANSACALGPDAAPLTRIGPDIEAFYRRNGQKLVFRLSPLAAPDDDTWLDERGYRQIEPTHVMRREGLPDRSPAPPPGFTLAFAEHPDDAWINGFTAGDRHGTAGRETLRLMLDALRPPAFFATLIHGDTVQPGSACGYGIAVIERGGVGLFDIQIARELHGRGLGRFLVEAMLARARNSGADHAWLQVLAANAPACALYARLGFVPLYGYSYRVRPERDP